MHRALICVLVLFGCTGGVFAGSIGSVPTSNLTVVLDFHGTHATRSINEMQREAERIVSDAGIHLDWATAAQASRHTYSDLVVVQFTGACVGRRDPAYFGELGPPTGALAFTYETDGAVQPFSRIYCNKVAASVLSSISGGDFDRADILMGRALGRVLVHELVHVLTRSGEHAHFGVEQRALSGQDLISASLGLSPSDLQLLRQSVNHRK